MAGAVLRAAAAAGLLTAALSVATVSPRFAADPAPTKRPFVDGALFAGDTATHTVHRTSTAHGDGDDFTWVGQPQSWHQQAIRIVDHPFTTLAELRGFGLAAKKAGVSVVELVGPQKTARRVGYWYGGLGLCDHINGSFPASDGKQQLQRYFGPFSRAFPSRATPITRRVLCSLW